MNRARLAAGLLAVATVVAAAETNGPAPPFAKGVLIKLDPAAKQLVLQPPTGDPRAFYWTDTTYVFRGKEKISASQLKTGDVVAVRFYPGPDGKLLVRRLKTYPAP